MKFLDRIFKRNNNNTVTEVKEPEPEFLNEYVVYVGNSTTYIYAKTTDEARQIILTDMKNDAPYYDSRYYTSGYLGPQEDFRVHLRGEVKVFFNGVSNRRNPDYKHGY